MQIDDDIPYILVLATCQGGTLNYGHAGLVFAALSTVWAYIRPGAHARYWSFLLAKVKNGAALLPAPAVARAAALLDQGFAAFMANWRSIAFMSSESSYMQVY